MVFGGVGGMDDDGPDVDGVEVVGLGDGDIVVGVKVVGFEGGAIVVGVKVVGLEDGAIVIGASEDAAPEEVASSEGASRVVERGQGRPAMDASRLFSIDIDMMLGIIWVKQMAAAMQEDLWRDMYRSVVDMTASEMDKQGAKLLTNRCQEMISPQEQTLGGCKELFKITVDAQEPASLSFYSVSALGVQGRMTP